MADLDGKMPQIGQILTVNGTNDPPFTVVDVNNGLVYGDCCGTPVVYSIWRDFHEFDQYDL